MFQVIKTGRPQHGQETISSNALLFVSWISRAMDWGQHNWVRDKASVSWLKLSKFHQDLNPHIMFIFRPGHGIWSRYWNSHFTGTMVRHPHHDNIKWLGQWILALYYLSRTIHYPHPVQSLGCKLGQETDGVQVTGKPTSISERSKLRYKRLIIVIYIMYRVYKYCFGASSRAKYKRFETEK